METIKLNDPKARFLELVERIEQLNDEYKQLTQELDLIAENLGEGAMFQDPKDMTVFEVALAKGKYVYYTKWTYNRTKKAGERQGSLSLKKAQEKGFIVPL